MAVVIDGKNKGLIVEVLCACWVWPEHWHVRAAWYGRAISPEGKISREREASIEDRRLRPIRPGEETDETMAEEISQKVLAKRINLRDTSLTNFRKQKMNFESQADHEYAREIGRERRDLAWVLSDRDVWYRNPFYTGPAVRHPEDDEGLYDEPVVSAPEEPGAYVPRSELWATTPEDEFDDIPF